MGFEKIVKAIANEYSAPTKRVTGGYLDVFFTNPMWAADFRYRMKAVDIEVTGERITKAGKLVVRVKLKSGFGEPGRRLENPIKLIFDTDHPPADADHALGYAGTYDERRRMIKAWHVTNDARQVIELIENGMPLLEMGGEHKDYRELGPGLYMSAVPQLWIGRATKKWEFLEHLNPMQRQALADTLGKIVLEQRQTGYITEGEYTRANRDLELFVDDANTGAVLQLAGQPHNISFWKASFLEPLGIKAGPTPEIVEFTVKGIFAGFDSQPQPGEIQGLIQDEFDGCYLRGGLMTIAQMVVWRNEAIVDMKRARL